MNRNILWIALTIITVVGLCIVGSIVRAVYLSFDQRQPKEIDAIYSPDGNLVINSAINESSEDQKYYLCVKIIIRDVSTEKFLWEKQTSASSTMKWSLHWLNNNTIKLQSSDIGDYCWKREHEDMWVEIDCAE